MDFLNSKPVKDFVEKGKLPVVDCNVTIETKTILNLTVSIFIATVLIILAYHAVKNVSK